MQDQDLPELDESLTTLPKDFRDNLAEKAMNDLWYMAYGILGYRKLTPQVHGGLCLFLSDNTSQFRLVLYPRDHFKTTLATISDTIRLTCRNPELRVLIANETALNAERFLSAIEWQWENNRVLRTLFSSLVPDTRKVRWNKREMELRRQGSYPEPTVDTIGAGGAVTSRHYNHIKLDDIISKEAADSSDVMRGMINWMDNIIALLVEPRFDRVDLIGTRWAFFDIYSDFEKAHSLLISKYIRGAIEKGQPIFPELMTLEILDAIREKNPYLYSCQYANNPRDPAIQDFNIKWVKRYHFSQRGDHLVIKEGEETLVIPIKSLDIVITIDPAISERSSGDRTAIVVCGVDPDGRVFVLDVVAERINPLQMFDHIFKLAEKWTPRVVGIEGVAYQKAIKYFLKDEMERRGKWLPIQELKVDTSRSKETRIRGLQPVVSTGRLFVRTSHQMLLDELDEFPLGEHDDIVDALAAQMNIWRGAVSKSRMEEFEKVEKLHLASLRNRSITGYGPKDDSAYNPEDFDADDDELEIRSAYEHQHTSQLEVA